jgi:hypothetical protein
VAREFPDVKWDKELVDAATARMVNRPATLDTIVATNLHADILSDLAAALAGSLGIAPTGNIDPERRYPSMFEPIHGSAFDIMGKGLANPVGTFWSVVMLLEHLGEHAAARRLMAAIEAVTANPALHTGDLGGRPPPPGDRGGVRPPAPRPLNPASRGPPWRLAAGRVRRRMGPQKYKETDMTSQRLGPPCPAGVGCCRPPWLRSPPFRHHPFTGVQAQQAWPVKR